MRRTARTHTHTYTQWNTDNNPITRWNSNNSSHLIVRPPSLRARVSNETCSCQRTEDETIMIDNWLNRLSSNWWKSFVFFFSMKVKLVPRVLLLVTDMCVCVLVYFFSSIFIDTLSTDNLIPESIKNESTCEEEFGSSWTRTIYNIRRQHSKKAPSSQIINFMMLLIGRLERFWTWNSSCAFYEN